MMSGNDFLKSHVLSCMYEESGIVVESGLGPGKLSYCQPENFAVDTPPWYATDLLSPPPPIFFPFSLSVCFVCSSAAPMFASCSFDQTAKLWSTERVYPLRTFIGHTRSVNVS